MKETLIHADGSDVSTSATLAEQVLKSFKVPGGLLGPNAVLMIDIITKSNTTTNTIFRMRLGGQLISFSYSGAGTQTIAWVRILVANQGSTGSQYAVLLASNGDYAADGVVAASGKAYSAATLAVDTTQDSVFTFAVQLGKVTDTYDVIAISARAVS